MESLFVLDTVLVFLYLLLDVSLDNLLLLLSDKS